MTAAVLLWALLSGVLGFQRACAGRFWDSSALRETVGPSVFCS